MKRTLIFLCCVFLLTGTALAGDFISGSTGADGAFNPTQNTELELPPDGIFNFTTVNIPYNIKITFKKNQRNTPVYILATGDVTISGTIDVSGTSAVGLAGGKGGPGGFDGGNGGMPSGPGGQGLGPGGGGFGPAGSYGYGAGGGFGTAGTGYSDKSIGGGTYLNELLVTMIGGSGGGGAGGVSAGMGGGGGGGGGAILIASSGKISINGRIYANGGYPSSGYSYYGGGGSGGSIKLLANRIEGNGNIYAYGGYYSSIGKGGSGRIRVETYDLARSSGSDPGFSFGYPDKVFYANLPVLKIASVAGINTPESAGGLFSTPDIVFPAGTANPMSVVISAMNVPPGTTVTLSATPEFGQPYTTTAVLAGSNESSSASGSVTLSNIYTSVLMVTATFEVQTASNKHLLINGEKVARMKVSTKFGGQSLAWYILESGKEVPVN